MRFAKLYCKLFSTIALGAALAALAALVAPPASAFSPAGACCFSNATCQDSDQSLCLSQGGSFIGNGTTCANVNCGAPVAAPVFSILGMVGVVGALGGLGAYRLLRKRR